MTQRSGPEKREALGHIGYEIWMCAACSARLDRDPGPTDPVVRNALLESELIHARAAIDFFLRSGDRRDITRGDFTTTDWQPRPPAAVDRLLNAKPLIDKYLAHLTWQRTDPNAQAWTHHDIAHDVIAVATEWTNFVATVDADLAEVLRPHILWARNELSGATERSAE